LSTKSGIYIFLKEMEKDKLRVCSGAFTESEGVDIGLNRELVRSLFIEQFDGSIVYRSRDCFSLVPSSESGGTGIALCGSCRKLKIELLNNMSSPVKGLGLSSFVEVCMDSDNDNSISPSNSQDNSDNYDKENMNDINQDDLDSAFPSLTRRYQQRKLKTTKVSYKKLIISAILSSPNNMLKLTEIYDWILERYPLFNENKTGFQNSIRHNLSLNRVFVKANLPNDNLAKGGYWTIEPSELKIHSDLTTNDVHASINNFKIRLPPKATERPEEVRKDLNISSRFVAIAPRPPPPKPLQFIQDDSTNSDDVGEDRLVIEEGDEAAKLLPQNLKDQLKKGLPIILRPIDAAATKSLPIIIQPSSVVSLNPVIQNSGSGIGAGGGSGRSAVTLNQRTNGSHNPDKEPKVISPSIGRTLSNQFTSNGTGGSNASVGSNEFPKPPFSFKELAMISIFFSPEKAMSLSSIYDHIKLWFPYYRQASIGSTWMNSIRHNLSLNKVFIKTDSSPGGHWSFDVNDENWKLLIISNKWFETPVDADLFEHMAKNCPEFQQKVYSKKSMFKTVPITVQSTDKDKGQTDKTQAEDSENPAKRIKLEEDPLNIKMETNRAQNTEDGDDEGEDDPSEAEDGVEVEGGQEEVDGGVEEVGGGENENEDFSSGSSEEDSMSNTASAQYNALAHSAAATDDDDEIEEDLEDDDEEKDPLQ